MPVLVLTPENHASQTAAHFSQLATRWARHYSSNGKMLPRIERFLVPLRERRASTSKVLDLGCGTGEISAACSRAGFKVTGADIAASMIDVARVRHQEVGLEFVPLDPAAQSKLPFADAWFDAVLCSSVLEYVLCPESILSEIVRILRPGGYLLATVPNPRHPIRHVEGAVRGIMKQVPGQYVYPLLPETIKRRLDYLELSISRFPLARWVEIMESLNLFTEEVIDPSAPLVLLLAQKRIGLRLVSAE